MIIEIIVLIFFAIMVYFIIHILRSAYEKKRIELLKMKLLHDKEYFKVPPSYKENKKEDLKEEDERTNEKFREYEKLRRIAKPNRNPDKDNSDLSRDAEPQGRELLSSGIDNNNTKRASKHRRTIELD